jgi:WD40 repeat protein
LQVRDHQSRRFSQPSRVIIIDAKTGTIKQTIDQLPANLSEVHFAPDDKAIALMSRFESRLHFWDLEKGTERDANVAGHSGGIWGLTFSRDGSLLVSSGGDQTIRVWKVLTAESKLVINTPHVGQLALSNDARTIATADAWDDTVHLRSATTGDLIGELDLGGVEGGLFGIVTQNPRMQVAFGTTAFSSDGVSISAVGYVPAKQVRWRTWRLKDSKELVKQNALFAKTTDGIDWPLGEAFSSDNKMIALGSKGLVKILDVGSAKELQQLELDNKQVAREMAFSPDNNLFVVGTDEGQLYVFDAQTWKRLHTFTASKDTSFGTRITFSADSKRMVTSTYGRQSSTLSLWDIPQWKRISLPIDETQQACCVALSPDGSQLAVGMLNGAIEVRSLSDLKAE